MYPARCFESSCCLHIQGLLSRQVGHDDCMNLKMFIRNTGVNTLTVQSQKTCNSATPTLTLHKFRQQISFRQFGLQKYHKTPVSRTSFCHTNTKIPSLLYIDLPTYKTPVPFNADTFLVPTSTVQLNTSFACFPDVTTHYACSSLPFPESIHEGE